MLRRNKCTLEAVNAQLEGRNLDKWTCVCSDDGQCEKKLRNQRACIESSTAQCSCSTAPLLKIGYNQATQQQLHHHLTLAQHLGLVKRPRESSLTAEEWNLVLQQSIERKDALHGCPICHENFIVGDQLLLSCSHIFHKQCLKRFEKFSRQRCCPVCRTQHYQTMAVRTSSAIYKNFSATRIQAAYRAYKCRKDYSDYKWRHPPNDPNKRKDWFAKKLESATNRLLHQLAVAEDNVNLLFADIDTTLATSKQIYDAVGSTDESELLTNSNKDKPDLSKQDVDWHLVVEKAIERHDMDCPICIMPVDKHGGSNLALLSCSHLFHSQCISAFEAFNGQPSISDLLCPICRCTYKRLEL